MFQGTLYVISAPSGAGKSSLIQALLRSELSCDRKISVSYTTRAPRPGEVHSRDYFFVNLYEFKTMISMDAFIEYAEVFGNYYGTARENVEQILKSGVDVLLDIDWQGAQQIRKKISQSRSIFILPPSKEELNRRLRKRSQDKEEIIKKRMIQAVSEISHYHEYDYLIINNNFNVALNDLKTIVQAEHLRINQQKKKYDTLISRLLEEDSNDI